MDLKKLQPKKILYYQPYNMGDVILSSPLIRSLKKTYPNADIDLMVIPKTEEIARHIPYVHQVILYDKEGRDRKLKEFKKLKQFLHQQHYDLAITTSHTTRSAMVMKASGAPFRIGSPEQGGFLFLTHTVREKKEIRHQSESFLDFLNPLGIYEKDSRLEVTVAAEDTENVIQKLNLNFKRPFVIICPFGSSKPNNKWTNENCSEFIKLLNPQADLYLIGAKSDEPRLEEINKASGGLAKVLAGVLNLGELLAFIKLADVLVTIDTGPLHMASAVGTRIVGLFGPSNPILWGPRDKDDIIITHDCSCKPCPMDVEPCKDLQCMKSIKADEVRNAVTKLLTKK